MRKPALAATGVLLLGAMVSIACGSSGPDSRFGSSSGSSGDGTSSGVFGSSGGGDSGVNTQSDECKKMDIVFAIDNSGSMQQEQDNLAKNFPKFVSVIDAYKTKSGDSLDYRIGVTTSDDTKEKGAFLTTRGKSAPSGCSAGPSRPWLERPDGQVADFFSCRAEIGTSGSNTERPLENVLLSVTDRIADGKNTSNGESFVRKDALLAFIIITDEDEGSAGGSGDLARPMSEYVPGFDKVKGERGKWAAAVIAGETACSSPGLGNAAEAKRLKQFITDVGKNGVFSSICEGDLTTGLTKALNTFDQACRDFPSGPVN